MTKRKQTRPYRSSPETLDRPHRRDAASPPSHSSGHWLYGWHPVAAAIANPRRACQRLIASDAARSRVEAILADSPHRNSIQRVERVARNTFESLLPAGAVHQGVALLALPLAQMSLSEACQEPAQDGRDVVIVLDQPSDPHNVGAVLRSAAAFGARAVVVPDRHAPDITPAMAKVASGALDRVPLVRVTNLARALADLKIWNYWCVGLDASVTTPLWRADFSGRTVLVMGSEGSGLRRLTREHCDLLASVPVAAETDSLNLSAATAIALYEAFRDR